MKTVEDRLDEALDAALEMTFPASDPIAVYIVEPRSSSKTCHTTQLAQRKPTEQLAA